MFRPSGSEASGRIVKGLPRLPPPAPAHILTAPKMAFAQSFILAADEPEKVARALGQAARLVSRPSGALVFAAGRLGERLLEVGKAVAQAGLGIPVCLASGAGTVTERGEVEGKSAASGIGWSGGSARPVSAETH